MNEDHIAIHQFFGYIMVDAPEFTPRYKAFMMQEDSNDPQELFAQLAQLLHNAFIESTETGDTGARNRNLLNRLINSIERGLSTASAGTLSKRLAYVITEQSEDDSFAELKSQFGPNLTQACATLSDPD